MRVASRLVSELAALDDAIEGEVGAAGTVSFLNGEPFSVGAMTVRDGKIVEIDFLADPARLRELDLTMLRD